MKIIVAPDKFKGSLTADETCRAISEGIRRYMPSATICAFPLADGGDGFSAALKSILQTSTITVDTVDPLGRSIQASYEWDASSETAIIELASASGLVLLDEQERNPMITSTFGTGLQIKEAIQRGAKRILLGLGGSATNDAGTGILAALGFRLLDADRKIIAPCGEGLENIQFIEPPIDLPNLQWTIACDVHNPMHGSNGAAFVYAAQKGADEAMINKLDHGLRSFEKTLNRYATAPIGEIPGTGAAGAVVAGIYPWIKPTLVSGVELLIGLSALEQSLADADLVITGEGKLDSQSLQGKVVGSLAGLGKKYNIPVVVVCGKNEIDDTQLTSSGIYFVAPIMRQGRTEDECKRSAYLLVQEATTTMLNTFFKP